MSQGGYNDGVQEVFGGLMINTPGWGRRSMGCLDRFYWCFQFSKARASRDHDVVEDVLSLLGGRL